MKYIEYLLSQRYIASGGTVTSVEIDTNVEVRHGNIIQADFYWSYSPKTSSIKEGEKRGVECQTALPVVHLSRAKKTQHQNPTASRQSPARNRVKL